VRAVSQSSTQPSSLIALTGTAGVSPARAPSGCEQSLAKLNSPELAHCPDWDRGRLARTSTVRCEQSLAKLNSPELTHCPHWDRGRLARYEHRPVRAVSQSSTQPSSLIALTGTAGVSPTRAPSGASSLSQSSTQPSSLIALTGTAGVSPARAPSGCEQSLAKLNSTGGSLRSLRAGRPRSQ
jgi:hypothetical protein